MKELRQIRDAVIAALGNQGLAAEAAQAAAPKFPSQAVAQIPRRFSADMRIANRNILLPQAKGVSPAGRLSISLHKDIPGLFQTRGGKPG